MKPITSFGLALYSSVIALVSIIVTFLVTLVVWAVPVFIFAHPLNNILLDAALVGFTIIVYVIVLYYMLKIYLHKKQEQYKVQLVSNGDIVPFKGKPLMILIWGALWRMFIIGLVMLGIAFGLEVLLGISFQDYRKFEFIVDAIIVVTSFWWLYAFPLRGNVRVLFSER